MVPDDPAKRKRGSIWAQLGTSACVILLPPALIAVGVVAFDSSLRRPAEPQLVVGAGATAQSTFVKSEERPDGAGGLALASAAHQTVLVERHRVDEQLQGPPPSATVGLQGDQKTADPDGTANVPREPVVENDRAATNETAAANETAAIDAPTATNKPAAASRLAPNYGPIPVAVVYVRKPGAPAVAEDEPPAVADNEQTAMADIEDPAPTMTHRHAPVAVPKPSLAVTRIRGAHVSRKMAPHEPIVAHRGKAEHVAERGPAHGLERGPAHGPEHGRLLNERRKVAGIAAPAAGLRHGPLHQGRIGRS
jgi:hypothetical protein